MLRQGLFSYHVCESAEKAHKRFKPYSTSKRSPRATTPVSARLLRVVGDVPQTRPLRGLTTSPAPTEVVPDSEPDREQATENLTENQKDRAEASGDESAEETDDDELPILSSDDLPSVLELLRR